MLRRTLSCPRRLRLPYPPRLRPPSARPRPTSRCKDASGKTVKLSDYRGKHVVLEWTNPGCPYVRKHYDSGNMPATQKEAVDKGVVWLSINSTEKSSLATTWSRPSSWPGRRSARRSPRAVLMDEEGTAGKAYGARTTPHMYIVDPQGRLVYAGGIDSIPSSNPDDIKKAVNYVKPGPGRGAGRQADHRRPPRGPTAARSSTRADRSRA